MMIFYIIYIFMKYLHKIFSLFFGNKFQHQP